MTAHQIFNLALKILGIYLLKDVLIAVAPFLQSIYSLGSNFSDSLMIAIFSSFSLLMYLAISSLLIFKTDWIISMLRLKDNFPQEPMVLHIDRHAGITFAVVFTGILIIAQSIPYILKNLAEWINYRTEMKGMFGGMQPFNYTWLIANIANIVVGILLISNAVEITRFIENKMLTNKPNKEE